MIAYRSYIPRPDRFIKGIKNRFKSPCIDRTTVQEVLNWFGHEVSTTSNNPFGKGRRSSLVVLSRDCKLFVKQYPATFTLPMILHEHSILRHLEQNCFPAPRLITSATGETVMSLGNFYYALFEFIEGGLHYHHYIWLPNQMQVLITQAGETLAHLHAILKDFVPEGQNPNGFKSQTEGRWRELDWYLSKLANCVDVSRKASRASPLGYLCRNASYMQDRLIELDDVLKVANLPRLIIHSDYGPYNLFFRPKLPFTVLDFEISRLDWRLSEFVFALPRFANHERPVFSFSKARCFLNGYHSILNVDSDELRYLPVVWQYLKIRQAIRTWHIYNETRVFSRIREAEYYLKRAMWAAKYHDVLIKNLCFA